MEVHFVPQKTSHQAPYLVENLTQLVFEMKSGIVNPLPKKRSGQEELQWTLGYLNTCVHSTFLGYPYM